MLRESQDRLVTKGRVAVSQFHRAQLLTAANATVGIGDHLYNISIPPSVTKGPEIMGAAAIRSAPFPPLAIMSQEGPQLATVLNTVIMVYQAQNDDGTFYCYLSMEATCLGNGFTTTPKIINPSPGGGLWPQIILSTSTLGLVQEVAGSPFKVDCSAASSYFFSSPVNPNVYRVVGHFSVVYPANYVWDKCS